MIEYWQALVRSKAKALLLSALEISSSVEAGQLRSAVFSLTASIDWSMISFLFGLDFCNSCLRVANFSGCMYTRASFSNIDIIKSYEE